MINKFCTIVFSHADTEEKVKILERSLEESKKIGNPIILATHLPVNERCQELADYIIKDSNNLVLNESDIFKEPINPDSELYYVHDTVSDGIVFSTSVFKKTYIPGVINLYINSFRLAKICGFDFALLLEFDFVIGESTIDSFQSILKKMYDEDLDYFCFESYIQDLHCLHAIPSFFKVSKVLEFLPEKILINAQDYNRTTGLKIIEQWMGSNVWKNSVGIRKDYTELESFIQDSEIAKIHSMLGKYLFFNLRSGIYFGENGSLIHYTNNFSNDDIECDLQISFMDNVMYQNCHKGVMFWAWNQLSEEVNQLAKTQNGVIVKESVFNKALNETSIFEYPINISNFSFISALKKVKGL
jgi:hypothetical protein